MPISSNRYVNITSAVGGGEALPAKRLSLRLYSTSERIPTGSVIDFAASSLSSILDYFGSESEEYKQAAYYFGFVSKVSTAPKNIQFARWADEKTPAQVFGSKVTTLDVLKTHVSGAFDVALGGVVFNVVGVDLSGVSTYSEVATELQTAIQLTAGAMAATTVMYDATRTAFEFNTNGLADGDIALSTVSASFIDDLGWGAAAILSNGVAEQTVSDVLTSATNIDNNYGSYAFIDNNITLSEIEESAIFVNEKNIQFMYLLSVLDSNKDDVKNLIAGYASCGITLNKLETLDQYPHLLPAAILASLDYDNPAASANFMYQMDDRLTPSVTDDDDSKINDALKINYMGQTQENGVFQSFYQKGVLTGGAAAPKAMGVHANEQWLKAYLKGQFLNMFLALQQVSADEVGQAIGITYLDDGIAKAIENGSISTGKTLTNAQINFIIQISGDDKAYLDVQSRGYWYNVTVDATTNEMDYLLIYAKRDSVDKVEGRHSLI